MQEPFALNELAVLQEPQTENHNVCLVTTLIHSSGEFMRSKFVVPCKQDAQGYGSAVTYARRYALSALAGVAPEEDDGNEASGKDNGGQKPAAQQRPAPQSIAPSLKPADQLDGEMCTYHLSKYFEGKDFEFVKSMTAKLKKMGGKDMGKDVWKVPQYIEQLAVYYKSDKQAA